MSEPIISIDTNEAQGIERNIIMQKIYYRPSGYHSLSWGSPLRGPAHFQRRFIGYFAGRFTGG